MGKYIKEFSNHTEYEEFVDQADFNLQTPNVSLCNRQNEVHYSPYEKHDYSQDRYLAFEIVKGGTLTWSVTTSYSSISTRSIEYSIDGGKTWTTIAASFYNQEVPFINAVSGQRIFFRGNHTTYGGTYKPSGSSTTSTYGHHFGGTATFNIYGNIKSMLNDANTFSNVSYCFQEMFLKSNVINAEHLILPYTDLAPYCYAYMFSGCTLLRTAPKLPATTLANSCYDNMFDGCISLKNVQSVLSATTLAEACYRGMFNGCTSLVTAPALPATILVDQCYFHMFNRCYKLISVTCLATNISAQYCTTNWLNNISSTGTFTKAASMNNWTTGVNGIPENWTIVDAS